MHQQNQDWRCSTHLLTRQLVPLLGLNTSRFAKGPHEPNLILDAPRHHQLACLQLYPLIQKQADLHPLVLKEPDHKTGQ
jgi:hypothetical protein